MQLCSSFFAGLDKQARAVHQITEVVIIMFPFLKLSLPLNLDNILNQLCSQVRPGVVRAVPQHGQQRHGEAERGGDQREHPGDDPQVIKGQKRRVFLETLILSMEMSYGTTGSLFRSGSRQTFFATQVTRLALYLSFVLRIELFPIKVCRYLRCLSAQHALLSHLLHVQR